MSGLSPERREELAQAILDEHRARLGFDPIPVADCAGPDDYTRPANAVAPLIAGWLAAEREAGKHDLGRDLTRLYERAHDAGAAEVRARVEALHQRQPADSPFNSEGRPADWPCATLAALNGGE